MNREVHVWHDQEGKIIALGHVVPHKKAELKATPLEQHGLRVITALVAKAELHKLAETHFVDRKSGKLTPRRAG